MPHSHDVDYIEAHATSTPAGDPHEVLAIEDALGDHAASVAVSSTKSVTGHLRWSLPFGFGGRWSGAPSVASRCSGARSVSKSPPCVRR